jgi:CubicO group peptidase (beta-lactamase class C family)
MKLNLRFPNNVDALLRSAASSALSAAFLVLTVATSASLLACQEPDARIARIESGLAGSIQVQGREMELFSLDERMAHYAVPGVSIAVLDRGNLAWAKGYGLADAETGEPVTTTTLFQAASISKPVAAMAALRLVEEGLVDLDAPVNDYLKDWTIPENQYTEGSPVTLRHLLTHTGGLTVHGFPGYESGGPVATTVEVLDGSGPANTDPIRVDTVPGSIWRYSGGGYTIMQKLLEDVTGKPFAEVLRDLVLNPAAMPLSSYLQPMPPGRQSELASGHLSDGTRAEGKWHVYPEQAAAGLWTNPTELAHLAMAVQASLNAQAGGVLTPEMTSAQLTPGLGGYGLGFAVRGDGNEARFSHGGSNHGFKAQFMAFKDGGRGVFIMTNGDRGSSLAQEIILAVAREYGWPVPGYEEVILAELPAEALEAIAGTYHLEAQDLDIEITVEGDHLKADVAGEQTLYLHPTAEDFFIDLSDGTRFRIHRDDEGVPTALEVLGAGLRAIRVGEEIR